MKRAALYACVSTVDQHLETQLLDMRQMAKHRDHEIIREYTDTISGTKSKRPGLDQLLADARRHRLDIVLVKVAPPLPPNAPLEPAQAMIDSVRTLLEVNCHENKNRWDAKVFDESSCVDVRVGPPAARARLFMRPQQIYATSPSLRSTISKSSARWQEELRDALHPCDPVTDRASGAASDFPSWKPDTVLLCCAYVCPQSWNDEKEGHSRNGGLRGGILRHRRR
jgi:resolvase-like protein